jgi:hypothetical protein
MIATIIILTFLVFNLGMEAQRHGEVKGGRHNFWISLFSTIITLVIYYFAGLFQNL